MPSEIYTTFLHALHVMNVALETNQDSPIFKLIMAACRGGLEQEEMVVEIQEDGGTRTLDCFTITLRDGAFVLVKHGRVSDASAWKVSEGYLRDVSNNPQKYIDHPTMLSFDWLRDRVEQMTQQAGESSRGRDAQSESQ